MAPILTTTHCLTPEEVQRIQRFATSTDKSRKSSRISLMHYAICGRRGKSVCFGTMPYVSIKRTSQSAINHQAGLMRLIYSRADIVVVWLGCESDNNDIAMQWIEDSSIRYRSSLGVRERLDLVSPTRILQQQTERWLALRDLCKKDYWYRVRIFQYRSCLELWPYY